MIFRHNRPICVSDTLESYLGEKVDPNPHDHECDQDKSSNENAILYSIMLQRFSSTNEERIPRYQSFISADRTFVQRRQTRGVQTQLCACRNISCHIVKTTIEISEALNMQYMRNTEKVTATLASVFRPAYDISGCDDTYPCAWRRLLKRSELT